MSSAAEASSQADGIRGGGNASPAVTTDIPTRLDRLPWSRFHLLVIIALGVTWILDGLEVTIVGAIGPVLQSPRTLGLTASEIGAAASAYVTGAVIGAMIFGWLTDHFGRRLIFYVTLIVYLVGVLLTATSWSFASFAAFRAITGLGIGGEYAAINSAIDELMPARYRGRIDIVVNGSFWIGAVAGSGASLVFLDPNVFAPDVGWRLAFAVGGVLCLGILLLRRHVPESPRWLITHGFARQADATIADIEQRVRADTGRELAPAQGRLTVHPRRTFGFDLILRCMLGKYRSRSMLALALMIAQAFLFNAVFFSYALVLVRYHGVASERTGTHLVTLAASNFLGPLVLGHFFDTIGRRVMISATYAIAGVLLIATALAFGFDAFSAWGQTFAWMLIFFFASAAASSAYLTASEIFPLETRALAIATFYAFGTAVGGTAAPLLFGFLVQTGSPWALAAGYAFAASLMLIAAAVEAKLGIDAEMRSLEQIADPLSAG
ncbi:MAG TPA: MFS transporter [Xanthobacteraceae bacterium]|jgi:MFS family permease